MAQTPTVVQTSLATTTNHKLAFKYFGPYEIESKVGTMAYRLKLPANTIHPIFHVSLYSRKLKV